MSLVEHVLARGDDSVGAAVVRVDRVHEREPDVVVRVVVPVDERA